MGELINLGTGSANQAMGFEPATALLSLLAGALGLGLLAVMDRNRNNDDDDSSPGGGLMQPVS
jgi:hypothetical protein